MYHSSLLFVRVLLFSIKWCRLRLSLKLYGLFSMGSYCSLQKIQDFLQPGILENSVDFVIVHHTLLNDRIVVQPDNPICDRYFNDIDHFSFFFY